MRNVIGILIACGLIFAFYQGLYETGVLVDESTPNGYYRKLVRSDIQFRSDDGGPVRVTGWHQNEGLEDLKKIRVRVFKGGVVGREEIGYADIGTLRSGHDTNFDVVIVFKDKEYDDAQEADRFKYSIEAQFMK